MLHDSTFTPGGGLTGKKYDIVQIVNSTPGSITYSVTTPTLGMTVFDAGAPLDGDYGDGYNFNGSMWNEFITSIGYTAGTGLTLTGNSFSIGAGQVTNSMLAGSITSSKLVGTDISTVGTITTGTWNATPITDAYISSSANWNAKLSSVSNLAGTGVPVYKNTVANNANFKRLIAGPGMTITDNTDSITISSSALTSIDTSNIANFYLKVRGLFSSTSPITYNSTTGLIGITQAGSSADGYLSSADWNTFNNKAGAFSTGNLSETGSSILTITGGTGAVVGSGTAVQVKQASGSQSGFLSSTDWTTFNNKLSSIDTSNISNFYIKVRSELSAGTGITYNNVTGVIGNSGVLSVNGNTGALTMDTSYISNFYLKTRGLLSGTAPVTYNSTTGAIGITQANSTTNGYLSSADWNTFNSKQSSGNYMTDPGSNGVVIRTALNTTTARTLTGTANRITITNGSGTGGNPTFDVGSHIVDMTVSNTYTGGAKQTFVNSGTTSGFNLTAGADPSSPAFGDFWNSTTTPNSIKYIDAGGATRTLVDLSLTQTLTNKTINGASNTITNIPNSALTNSSITVATGTSGTDVGVTGSPVSLGGTVTLNIPIASATNTGKLSAADWNTFNNKLGSVDTSSITNFYTKVRSELSGGAGITYNNSTGVITNSGVLSLNGNTGALTMDTGYINNFYLKVRGLNSASAPITYNSTTGAIGITQANSTTNGYLSSADWNTFDNKAGSFSTGNLTESGSSILTISGGTGAVIGSGTTVQVKQATSTQNGFLSSTDWNTFNNKLGSIDTSNISNFYLKVRNELSVNAPVLYNSTTGLLRVDTTTGATHLATQNYVTTRGYLSTIDTGNISNFYLKVRGLNSASAPITYNSSTGAIGITQASNSTNGYLSSTDWNTFNNKQSALTFSTGLTNLANTITANLSTGKAGGQSAIGGTASGDNLTLSSTTNATKGNIFFGNSTYDEANNMLDIGTTTSINRLTIGNGNKEAISRDGRTGTLEVMGGTSEATGAYFQITGDQNTTSSPYEGSAEFVIRNLARSQFTLWSYDGASTWTQRMQLLGSSGNTWWTPNGGSVGIGLPIATTPTALLHIAAGTSAANTAPLKFTAGTNLTTPEDGAVEYNGTHFYATIGSTRYQLDQQGGSNSTLTINGPLTGGSYDGSSPVSIGITTATIPTASTIPTWDVNKNLSANNFINGYQTFTTSGGTTTFTVSSPGLTFFTGSSNQTLSLPNATTLVNGQQYNIHNNSTGAITVKMNGGTSLWTIASNADVALILTNNGSSAGTWDVDYIASNVSSGKVLTVNNTLTLSGTDGSTLNIGTGGTLGSAAYTTALSLTTTGSSGAATFNSGTGVLNIPQYSGGGGSTLTISSPLTGTSYNGSAPVTIGIPQATTTTSGYLSNTDWNTFNGKGDMILAATQTVTGPKTFAAGTLIGDKGTTSNPPLQFNLTGSTLETTSGGGDVETDANGMLYYSHASKERGIVNAEQFITLTSSYTTSSGTGLRKMFNSTANGAVTLASSTAYFFECEFDLSSMSSTSGNFSFGFGGTATFTSVKYSSSASKSSLTTPSTSQIVSGSSTSAQALTSSNTTTTGYAHIRGIVRINAGGTLIPEIAVSQSASPVVGSDSYFRIWPIGTSTVTNVGNWN